MWYNVDFNRFAMQLLPPILRSKTLVALLNILVHPLLVLYNKFMMYRAAVAGRLNITAHVQFIEKALNDTFFLTKRQIYIATIENEEIDFLHFVKESLSGVVFYRKGEEPHIMLNRGEMIYKPTFTVYVPKFLCTSLDSNEDRFHGTYLRTILNLLAYYKPAGRTFRIELYDYE